MLYTDMTWTGRQVNAQSGRRIKSTVTLTCRHKLLQRRVVKQADSRFVWVVRVSTNRSRVPAP